jgi:hypothetical protein
MEGAVVDKQERVETLASIAEGNIDRDFLPYLDRLNNLPFVATQQCCIGHMEYKNPHLAPPRNNTGRWGYLQMLTTQEAAESLMPLTDSWDWLWIAGSQFWLDGASEPGITECGSIQIAFAWDSQFWPKPALDICRAMEAIQSEMHELVS